MRKVFPGKLICSWYCFDGFYNAACNEWFDRPAGGNCIGVVSKEEENNISIDDTGNATRNIAAWVAGLFLNRHLDFAYGFRNGSTPLFFSFASLFSIWTSLFSCPTLFPFEPRLFPFSICLRIRETIQLTHLLKEHISVDISNNRNFYWNYLTNFK